MGISGLLPLLKSIHKPCHIKKFAGLTIGVDTYGWLHRGTVSCAIDLALEKPTTKFVDYAMGRVRMLIHFGITPYLVFDGDYLPSKADTEAERAQKRAESKRIGLDLYRMGKTSEAQSELQKAVDVTPEMARQLIDELKLHNVAYVVAPYEADAQLAYLERRGIIQGILSEDSDLLVFGSKLLLTKLDQYGECVAISRDDFTACRDIDLAGWTDDDFRRMAILSGCDYLANISKMGLKKAHRMVRRYKSIDRIVRMMQLDSQYRVPPGYLEAFRKAELTFLHQRVFCPLAQRLVMFTEIGKTPEDFAFIGKDVQADIAIGVAQGELNPVTKKVMRSVPTIKPGIRRHSYATPKNGTTIEKFFASQRTPLAELDPNVFTPSPSQQRLLGQQNTWSGIPARSTSTPFATSAPNRSKGMGSSPALPSRANGSQSASYSCKRPRLCNSIEHAKEDADDLPNSFEGQSHFFPIPGSPLSRRRKKKAEVNIWSDASLDEALSNLPDDSELGKPGKMSVFLDGKVNRWKVGSEETKFELVGLKVEEPKVIKERPDTEKRKNSNDGKGEENNKSKKETRESIPANAWQRRMTKSTKTLQQRSPMIGANLEAHALKQSEWQKLSDRYSSHPKEAAKEMSKEVEDLSQLKTLRRNSFVNWKSVSMLSAQDTRRFTPPRMQTPLQRLQAVSLRRSFSAQEPDLGAIYTTKPPKLHLRGSEDCLVPNSDDDQAEDSNDTTEPTAKIDLKRFMSAAP